MSHAPDDEMVLAATITIVGLAADPVGVAPGCPIGPLPHPLRVELQTKVLEDFSIIMESSDNTDAS